MEVTGSRLRSLVGEQPAVPVLSINNEELVRRGVTRLADVRWAIPQLGVSQGFNDNLVNGGPSRAQMSSTTFDLRGLGGNSTLVLVNGRRIPHSGQAFPGGAGGREDFNVDGLPISAIERIDVLPQGAGAIYGADAIAGVVNLVLKKNYSGGEIDFTYDDTFSTDVANFTTSLTAGFTQDKLTTFFTVSRSTQNALGARDRYFTANAAPSVYSPLEGATLSMERYPATATSPVPGFGTPVVALPAGTTGTDYTTGDLTDGSDMPLYRTSDYSQLINESDTTSVSGRINYRVNNLFEPYAEVRWSRMSFDYVGTPLTFLNQLPVGYIGNPFDVPVYLSKTFYDIRPQVESSQENSAIVLGTRGNLPAGWTYDLSYTWTRNQVWDNAINNGFNYAALTAALAETDPSRQINFAYDSATMENPNGQSLIDLLSTTLHEDTSDLYSALFSASGPIWEGWAGDVQLAVGGESQREEVEFFLSPALSYALQDPFTRTINAAFAEVAVPLLGEAQDLPLVHRLEVRGAIRHEDFSDIGGHASPSVSVLFQPVEWMTLRANRSEGFKAPKLYDLLSPYYDTTTNILERYGYYDPYRGNEAVFGTYDLSTGGQPGLQPETSVSYNAGIVIDVPGIEGLSLSADWWETEFDDRVGSASYQVLFEYFPERITRGPRLATDPADWLGPITGIDSSSINLSWVRATGMDFSMTYHRMTGWGEFLAHATYTKQDPQEQQATPGSSLSYRYFPERLSGSLAWIKGPWEAGVSVNYQGTYTPYGPTNTTWIYPSLIEWNPRVAYQFGRDPSAGFFSSLLSDTKLSLTVINALNNKPGPAALASNRYVNDPRLSRYVLSLNKKF